MLRVVVLSLLAGVLFGVAGIRLVFSPPPPTIPDPAALTWRGDALEVRRGTAEVHDGQLRLRLNEQGIGIVAVPVPTADIRNHPFLFLDIPEWQPGVQVVLGWTTSAEPDLRRVYRLEEIPLGSMYLDSREIRGFSGELNSLALLFNGEPRQVARIAEIALLPDSLWAQLRSVLDDWTGFEPVWRRAAVNHHTGAVQTSPFYPAPLAAAFLLLSLAAYAALVLLFRRARPFRWRVAGLLFLCYWVALDLPWQFKLQRRAIDTAQQFAGLSTEEKRAAGPDRAFYGFVAAAREHMGDAPARVFVASSDEYTGLRSAYYLYPHNVFWSLHGPAIPHPGSLRRGDYILLMRPTDLVFDRHREKLRSEWPPLIDARKLLGDNAGMLLQVH